MKLRCSQFTVVMCCLIQPCTAMELPQKNAPHLEKKQETPLIDAVKAHDLVRVNELLPQKTTDVHQRDSAGNTALYYSLADGQFEIARQLVVHKADVNAKDVAGKPLLFALVERNNFRAVRFLLDYKVNTQALYNNKTAIQYVEGIVKKNQDINDLIALLDGSFDSQDDEGNTNLMRAVKARDVARVRDLALKVVDIDVRNKLGLSALALALNNIQIARVLVEHGADVDLRFSIDQITLLMYSVFTGNRAAVEFLVEYGADINLENSKKRQAFNFVDTITDKESKKAIKKILLRQTYKEWNDICFENLPVYQDMDRVPFFIDNRTVDESMKQTDGDARYLAKKSKTLASDDLLNAFAEYRDMVARSAFVQNGSWMGNMLTTIPVKNIEQAGNEQVFEPFVERAVLPAGAKVVIQGDRHGDIHSVLHFLHEMQIKKYIARNSYKIIDPDLYLLFLGDTIDRGVYSLEVAYTLMCLKQANPDRVFIIRGNHELWKMALSYGLAAELSIFVGQDSALGDRIKNAFINWFNLLPVALYLGCNDGAETNYVQCCHGGIEIGYNPQAFLTSGKQYAAVVIKSDDRKNSIEKNGFKKLETDQSDYQSALEDIEHIGFTATKHEYLIVWDAYTFSASMFGHMWSDFIYDKQEALYKESRGPSYGKATTALYLKSASSPHAKLQGFLRAHQHEEGTAANVMGAILNSDEKSNIYNVGVAKLWEPSTLANRFKLWPGIVCTFNIAPHTNIGSWNGYFKQHGKTKGVIKDFWGLLTVAKKFDDWKLEMNQIDHPEK